MKWHFSIDPAGEPGTVLADILAYTEKDPCIIHFDRGKMGHLLLFCWSSELVPFARQQFEQEGMVSPSICGVEIHPEYGIFVNQECSDDSREYMAGFIKWVLRNFSPCKVFDTDEDEDISELVIQNPDVLFEYSYTSIKDVPKKRINYDTR